MDKICKNCLHWQNIDGAVGQCRRYPPLSGAVYEQRMERHPPAWHVSGSGRYFWPQPAGHEWCGEWMISPSTYDLMAMAQKAKAVYAALSAEEKAEHDRRQRESFARANISTGDPRFD